MGDPPCTSSARRSANPTDASTTRLVEQSLTLSRVESGQFGGPREACDLRGLAKLTIGDLAPTAIAKKIDIELLDGGPVALEGYPALIGILMRNRIDNAVRYSPARSTVRVCTAASDGIAELTVTDQGTGIPAARARKWDSVSIAFPGPKRAAALDYRS